MHKTISKYTKIEYIKYEKKRTKKEKIDLKTNIKKHVE